VEKDNNWNWQLSTLLGPGLFPTSPTLRESLCVYKEKGPHRLLDCSVVYDIAVSCVAQNGSLRDSWDLT
jgi:hypothetical protein